MNKRIRELAEQAKFVMNVSNDPNSPPSWWAAGHNDTFEKFAELIVRECADICLEMAAKCAGLPGDGALAKDCAFWIKKDFGVE